MLSAMAAAAVRSSRVHSPSSMPELIGCTCPSWKPGSTIFPLRSTTSVLDPTRPGGRLSLPTYTMRPSRTATELAQLRAASMVYTAALRKTRSAAATLRPVCSSDAQADRASTSASPILEFTTEAQRAQRDHLEILRTTSRYRLDGTSLK